MQQMVQDQESNNYAEPLPMVCFFLSELTYDYDLKLMKTPN